jgi:hypothetical protein
MMFGRHHITKIVAAVTAIAALGITVPGTAAADATDDAFMHKLFVDGVNFAVPEMALKRARVVCDLFGKGMSPAGVHAKILADSAFSARQTAIFMADAVQSYCPGYGGQFISSTGPADGQADR